jgi:hypothetical protein
VIFLECVVAVTCPYYKYCYALTPRLGQVRNVGGVAGLKGSIYGLCVDRKGVGAVKRGMNMNPNQRKVLPKCMLLLRIHDAILLRAQH